MLQQTQVKTVLPRYLDWFAQFPDIQTLAAAPLTQVYKQWEGLGYYRRARFIHETANIIMQHFNGNFPELFTDIMQLKGIGRSTAGAIASFCFGASTPVLDGNVKRGISAWHNKELTEKELWEIAQQYIDASGSPDLWNQSMMELGATLCQAKKRECERCPVATGCKSAFCEPETKTSSIKVKDVHWQVQLYQCPKRGIWLEQRPASGIWGNLWTPPIIELEHQPESNANLTHQLTHRKIHLYLQHGSGNPQGNGVWAKSLHEYALPTGIHKLLEQS